MPASNPVRAWHHVSVRDPKEFQIVATIQLGRRAEKTDRSDFGIQARIGREKGKKGGTKFVTLLFDPRLWTLARAKKWAKDHGEIVREADKAPEKPDYALSGRARAIGHDRREAESVKQYRKDLLKAGVGVEIPRDLIAADVAKTVSWVSDGPEDRTAAVRFALKHGAFTDGERCLLIVPPDLVKDVRGVLKMLDPKWMSKRMRGGRVTRH